MNRVLGKNLDLQLLRIFLAIVETGSVSLAADLLGTSQPTVSYGLNRLRELLGDALFVRVNNRMRPTTRAQDLIVPMQRVLTTLENEIFSAPVFDPASSKRRFTFCMTDIGESHYIPPIIDVVRRHAPGVTLRVVALSPDGTAVALENGQVDLAVGYFPDLLTPGFYQQQLSVSSFVCIGAPDNPHLRGALTLERYLAAPHVVVNAPARSQEVLTRLLGELDLLGRLNVVLEVPRFLTLLNAVSQTDLIASVPREAASYLQKLAPLSMRSLPFEVPMFSLKQHWHQRFHNDPAIFWLRRTVSELFQFTAPEDH